MERQWYQWHHWQWSDMVNRTCLILIFMLANTCCCWMCISVVFRKQQTIYFSHPLLWVIGLYSLSPEVGVLGRSLRRALLSPWLHLGAILTVLLSWSLWGFYTPSIPFSPGCPLHFSTKAEAGLKSLVHLSIMNPPDAGGFTKPPGSDSQWGM